MGMFTDDVRLTDKHEAVIEAADALLAVLDVCAYSEHTIKDSQFRALLLNLDRALAACPGTRAYRMTVQRGSWKPLDVESLPFVLPE